MNEHVEFVRNTESVVPVKSVARTMSAACSVEDMEQILQRVVQDSLSTEVPLSELLEEEVQERRGTRPVGVRPLFELRFRSSKFNEQGIVGHVSRKGFERKVRDELVRHLESLRAEQPACDWKLVAAIIESTDLQKTVPIAQMDEDGRLLVDSDAFRPQLDVRRLREDRVNKLQSFVGGYQEKPHIVWRLRCAYADISQADIVDPNFRVRGQKQDPAFTQYVEKRQTRYMPTGMLKNRNSAKKVIRLFMEAPVVVVRNSAAARIPVVEQLSEAQLESAVIAREEGLPTARLAAMMGIPPADMDRFEDKLLACRRRMQMRAAWEEKKAEEGQAPPGGEEAPPSNPPARPRTKPKNSGE